MAGARNSTRWTRLGLVGAVLSATLAAEPLTGSHVAAAEGPARITMACTGKDAASQSTISALGLSGLALYATSDAPAEVPLGKPTTAAIEWTYEVSAEVASLARGMGITGVTVTGARLAVAVAGPGTSPAGEASTAGVDKHIDFAGASTVELGTATAVLDTTVGGAVTYTPRPSDLRVSVAPAGTVVEATCRPAPQVGLAPTFVVDPAAPRVAHPVIQQRSPDGSAVTVNLPTTAGISPVPSGATWSVTATPWGGTATVSTAGVLTITPPPASAFAQAVVRLCATAATPTTTTTTSSVRADPTTTSSTTSSTTTTSTTTGTSGSSTTSTSVPGAGGCAGIVVDVDASQVLAGGISATSKVASATTTPTPAPAAVSFTG